MKFSCQVDIELPIDQVVELWSHPDNLKEWQVQKWLNQFKAFAEKVN